eukprot:TRINITY_DN4838_c0_g1_i8.p1 TRINITY_DN4838_c0_g1~~TRINITY_DN4838_c0_g1_i8.p1  ORF type:complete len:812 (+),score=166.16 TRINITY_DN4838_c0_g1_i8:495-2930(+)
MPTGESQRYFGCHIRMSTTLTTTLTSTTLSSTVTMSTTSTEDVNATSLEMHAEQAESRLAAKEENKLDDMLKNISKDQLENESEPVTSETESSEGNTTIALVSKKAAAAKDRLNIKASCESGSVDVSLPSGMFAGSSGVAVSVMSQGNKEALEADAHEKVHNAQKDEKAPSGKDDSRASKVISGQPIKITHYGLSMGNSSESARELEVKDLTVPIEFTVQRESNSSHCAYWDDRYKRWSTQGVTSVLDPSKPDSVTCQATHLSLFAPIESLALDVMSEEICFFKHSDAPKIFSAAGLEALRASEWQLRDSAKLLWFVLFCCSLAVPLSFRQHCADAEKFQGHESILLITEYHETEAKQKEANEEEAVGCYKACCNLASKCKDLAIDQLSGDFKACAHAIEEGASGQDCTEALKKFAIALLKFPLSLLLGAIGVPKDLGKKLLAKFECPNKKTANSFVEKFLALDRGYCPETLKHVKETATNKGNPFLPDSCKAALNVLNPSGEDKDQYEKEKNSKALRLARAGSMTRVFELFKANHPFTPLFTFSIFSARSVRCAVLVSKVLGALVTAAFFFHHQNKCEKKGWYGKLVTEIALGLKATVMSNLILGVWEFLDDLSAKAVTSVKHERELPDHQWRWKMREFFFWFLWVLYIAACVLFLCIFIAVTPVGTDTGFNEHGWAYGIFWNSVADYILVPAFVAVLIACWADFTPEHPAPAQTDEEVQAAALPLLGRGTSHPSKGDTAWMHSVQQLQAAEAKCLEGESSQEDAAPNVASEAPAEAARQRTVSEEGLHAKGRCMPCLCGSKKATTTHAS